MKNKNLTKKILISALIGLGVGVFVFSIISLPPSYQSNKILTPLIILALILVKISSPLITLFIHLFSGYGNLAIIIAWIIIGGLIGLIAGLLTKRKK